MRSPAIDTTKLQPEDTPISPQDFRHLSPLHCIEVKDSLYARSESCAISFSYIGNFSYWKSFKEFFYTWSTEIYIRSKWFIEITEHLGSDTSIGYPYRYRYANIPIYLILERLSKVIIPTWNICKFSEKLVYREYFYPSELIRQILHEPIGYLPIPSMIWLLHNELLPEYSLSFPNRSTYLDTKSLAFIACSYYDLVSHCYILPLERRISENFTGSIKAIAIYVRKDASRCMENHILTVFSDRA
jgi:hypothetical protein